MIIKNLGPISNIDFRTSKLTVIVGENNSEKIIA